jgi:hypothetical protein
MPTPRDLAAAYGLSTADALPPRPKPPDDAGALRTRWSAEKRLAFSTLRPAALCLVATDGPVSVTLWHRDGGEARRIGHNRGVWPAKIARTGAWKDTVTTTYDRNPFFWVGTQCRWWCATDKARDALAAGVVDLLTARAEEFGASDALLNGFVDLGAEIDLAILEMEVFAIAERLRLQAWDDDGLSVFLDRVVRRAQTLRAESRGMRNLDTALEHAANHEMGL